jgi:hypothetical protein
LGLLTAASLGVLLYALASYEIGLAYYGAAAAQTWSLSALIPAAILLPVTAAAWLWIARRRTRLCVFQLGLTLEHPGRVAKIVRWEDLSGMLHVEEQILFPWGVWIQRRTSLVLRRGRKLHLHPLLPAGTLAEAATRIKAAYYPHLEPDLRRKLLAGETLQFGKLELNHAGLGWSKQFTPWSRVQRLDIQQGRLLIYLAQRPNNPVRIALADLPNADLLLPLARLASRVGLTQTPQPGFKHP